MSADTQPTLAAYGSNTSAESDDTSTRPDPLTPATGPPQTTLTDSWDTDALAHLYRDGLFPAEIAAQIDAALSATQIRDRLRRAGTLDPADDRTALAHVYDGEQLVATLHNRSIVEEFEDEEQGRWYTVSRTAEGEEVLE